MLAAGMIKQNAVEADVPEWPAERQRRLESSMHGAYQPFAKFDAVLAEQLGLPPIEKLTAAIIRFQKATNGPESSLSNLRNLASKHFGTVSEPGEAASDLLIARSATEALRRVPTAQMWEYLWSLAWHSSALEYGFPRAVAAIAGNDPALRQSFLEIARGVLTYAVNDPGRREISRDRMHLKHLTDEWHKRPDQAALWSGQAERVMRRQYRDDDGIFWTLAQIDLAAFVDFLSLFDTPYPIIAALQAAGALSSFHRWSELADLAPSAFGEDGVWNGSSIFPCLLNIAESQLNHPLATPRPNAPDEEVKAATQTISELANEIAQTVAKRLDAIPCAKRWSTWLMRQSMAGLANENPPFPADARSRGYIGTTLIDALAKTLPQDVWTDEVSADAEPWEPWVYRAALTNIKFARNLPMPPTEDFLAEWHLGPEDWRSQKGADLKAHGSLFNTFGQRPDAYGTRLLALPLVVSGDPAAAWLGIWSGTETLREIIEFGDEDDEQAQGWSGRSDASGLMRLALGLGLMMLDHIIFPGRPLAFDRRAASQALLAALTEAAAELQAIDHLDQGYLVDFVRHLAIRRAVWLSGTKADVTSGIIFDDNTPPTLADFIRRFVGDAQQLFPFIDVALKNQVAPETLRTAIALSGVELSKQIALGERLLAADAKRAGIAEQQLSAARSLISER